MWYGPAHLGSTFSTALTRDPPYCVIIIECSIHTPTFCVSRLCQNWPFLHTNSIPEEPRSISVNPSSNLRGPHCSKGRSNTGCATNPCEVPALPIGFVQEEFVFTYPNEWVSEWVSEAPYHHHHTNIIFKFVFITLILKLNPWNVNIIT